MGRTILVRGQFGFGPITQGSIMPLPIWRVRQFRPGMLWVRPLNVVLAPGVTGRTPVTWSTLVAAGWELAARLPVIGPMVPDALAEEGIVYRVRLLPRSCASQSPPCADAVLLRVAP